MQKYQNDQHNRSTQLNNHRLHRLTRSFGQDHLYKTIAMSSKTFQALLFIFFFFGGKMKNLIKKNFFALHPEGDEMRDELNLKQA